jgi:hypothetical protein
MTGYEFKIGDRIEVIHQSDYMFPDVGEQGVIVSMINDYPKIKFDREQVYSQDLKDLNGLVTVDPISIKLVKI